jgi:hypothetical protein
VREGDSYVIVLTVSGEITKDLEELLEQEYPDENKLGGIQKLITRTFQKGELQVLNAEHKVSFTNIERRE